MVSVLLLLESDSASVEIPLTAIVVTLKGSYSFEEPTMVDLAGTFTGDNLHYKLHLYR